MAAVPNKLGINGGRFYSTLNKPVLVDCNFVVDSTNGNGFGVRSLKGVGVKRLYMATSASFVGSTHTNTTIDSISGGTSSLRVGMVIAGSGIAAGTKIVSINSSSAITVSLATSTSVGSGTITYVAVGSPMVNTGVSSASVGYAYVILDNNYNKYIGGFSGFVSPLTGGNVAINGSALTVGKPYVIVSVGAGTKGAVTIAPVADSSGSLASTYFTMPDGYGNQFVIWFKVSGVGSAPVGVSGTLIQQSITTNDSAATIGTALAVTLNALPASQPGNLSAPSGVFSFTATGTTTVTATSTVSAPLPGGPQDGLIPTGFTFAITKDQTNTQNWQAVGLPAGVVPSVGAAFIATATGYSSRGGSTGLVKLSGVSGITDIEVIGDPDQTFSPIPMGGSGNVGAMMLVQFLSPTVASVATTPAVTNALFSPMIPTAPADGTVVSLSFYVEAGSVIIDGE